jgi:hypothetical protein
LTAKQHFDVQALEKLSSKGKKAKQRRIIVKTLQNVKDKANELTGGTYLEQPVDLLRDTFAHGDILRHSEIKTKRN